MDDITISEVVAINEHTGIQQELDRISSWTANNDMKLNAKQCKELTVCFAHHLDPPPPSLTNDGRALVCECT